MITTLIFDLYQVIAFQESDLNSSISEQRRKDFQSIEIKALPALKIIIDKKIIEYIGQQQKSKQTILFSASELLLKNENTIKLIGEHFGEMFSSKKLGLAKDIPASYIKLARKLRLDPKEILFVDDKLINVDAARQAGLSAIQFQNYEQFVSEASTYLDK
jgi:HAD superfamily hydrolase (TIGR01509 family)